MIKLLSGQLPDQANPGETLASYTMARDYGVRPGTVIRMPTPAPSQTKQEMQALAGEGPPPARFLGPVVTLRVTGIVVAENEFPSGQGPSYDLYPTAAFAAATKDIVALTFYNVRLKHGAADLAHFEATVAGNFPLLVAIVVAVCGTAALAHLMAVSVAADGGRAACSRPWDSSVRSSPPWCSGRPWRWTQWGSPSACPSGSPSAGRSGSRWPPTWAWSR